MTRILLIALTLPAVYGSAGLCAAEWHYARGMATTSVGLSIDHMTRAGEIYPAAFTFRTAQAMQLFGLSHRFDGVAPAAAESLARALAVDPASADLASKLLAVQRGLGLCTDAADTAARLLRIAPRSAKARAVASVSCG